MDEYSYEVICHHGILGQRWGIRRYQNKDGTLTPRGRKRLEKLNKQRAKLDAKRRKVVGETGQVQKPRTYRDFDDDELKERTGRMKLENDYNYEIERHYKIQKGISENRPKPPQKFIVKAGKALFAEAYPMAMKLGKEYVDAKAREKLGLKKPDQQKQK